MSNRLSKEDWNKLDDLLGKHGFGGYYDLIECLKMTLVELGFGNTGIELDGCDAMKLNLPEVVKLLSIWAEKLSHTEGFQEIAEKAGEEK